MKKPAAVFLCMIFLWLAAGCGGGYGWEEDFEDGLEEVDMDSLEELYHIRIMAGDTVLDGILYDTQTSRDFAAMLPLTVELWHPAPDFARAFDLPRRIPRYAKAGYAYELGSLAYWYEGPSVALIYEASREETVVPVVPIGKIISDVSVFKEYGGTITIEIDEEQEPVFPLQS